MIRIAAVFGEGLGGAEEAIVRKMLALRPELASEGASVIPGHRAIMGAALRSTRRHESTARQPLRSESGYLVVADARLDNAPELRAELPGGATAQSDAELVALGYQRWGAAIIPKLRGDFACLIWDASQDTVLAARDGMGVRPLFFAELRGRLWLASEVEQLLCVPGLPRTLNTDSVLDYLAVEALELDCSLFESICRVRPGHFLSFRAGAVRQNRFWHPQEELGRELVGDAETAFRDALSGAVKRRLESDHPAIVYLSGGLDSSSVATIAEQHCQRGWGPNGGAIAASAAFPGLDCDESEYIDLTSSGFCAMRAERWNHLERDWVDLDAPSPGWPGAQSLGWSTGDLSLIRRTGSRIVLGGDGGDEVCADRAVLPQLARAGRWRAVISEALIETPYDWQWSLRELRRAASARVPMAIRRLRRAARIEGPPCWLAADLRARWRERQAVLLEEQLPVRSAPEQVAALLSSRELGLLPERLQRYVSIAGAEMRFPYLDHSVLRVGLSLSVTQRRPHGWLRGFQRRALSPLLLPRVLEKPRLTFESARRDEALAVLPRLRSMMSSGSWHSGQFVDPVGLTLFLDRLIRSRFRRHEWRHWNSVANFANLESWLRRIGTES